MNWWIMGGGCLLGYAFTTILTISAMVSAGHYHPPMNFLMISALVSFFLGTFVVASSLPSV